MLYWYHTICWWELFNKTYWECCLLISKLAVSTRPPAWKNYHASRSNSLGTCAPLSGVSLAFTRCQLLLWYCCCCCYRAWFIVVRQMALTWILCHEFCHEFYYIAHIDKWPWPWLKHSLGQLESLCQVWSWSAQPFGRPLATYRQTDKQTYCLLYVRWLMIITD